jgi:Flp pilus assembly protein CpaB
VDVPQARRLTRPRWVNARTALGVVLFTVAVVSGQRVLQGARTTVPVWSAARDLAAYSEMSTADLRAVEVKLPGEQMQHYATTSTDLVGSVLSQPVRAGQLIPLEWLSTDSDGPGRSLTIPVTPEHAVGAALEVGDRVDVLATFDAGDVRARTMPVVRAAEIVDVVSATGLVVEGESLLGVTVAVSPEEAARVAFAIRVGEIDLARVDASRSDEQAGAVRARDLQ